MLPHSCNHLTNSASTVQIANILNSRETPACADCGYSGPTLWICLYNNCFFTGCSSTNNDHSTIHNITHPLHSIQLNLLTNRLWCYECKNEVFLDSINQSSIEKNYDQDNLKKSYSKNVSTVNNNKGHVMVGDTSESESEHGDDLQDCNSDKPLGLVGLQNIGNTCYMNAALQALINTIPLASFFIECDTNIEILSEDKKPCLSRTFKNLIKDIWIKRNGGYIAPTGILYGIRTVCPMFRGYFQHDTQEFLRNFMDQLHEELKQIAPSDCDFSSSTPLMLSSSSNNNTSSSISPPSSQSLLSPPQLCDNNNPTDNFDLAMDEPSNNYDSSEGEYETCDSGVSERSSLSDDTERNNSTIKRRISGSHSPDRRIRITFYNRAVIDAQPSTSSTSALSSSSSTLLATSLNSNNKQVKYRSIISDIFDGKLLSSVQCLTCDRISSRIETFQDLSLPIPSRDHLIVLHGRNNNNSNNNNNGGNLINGSCSSSLILSSDNSWMSWILAWFKSWFYGPTVTLHDCLAAFFSTDELKGDNMYSCEKCNKLRNGIKFSKVLLLPEILCIHLKRFRHELMYSSKISSSVSFPLKGLDMRLYLHNECISNVTTYDLYSIICHNGTAGGGHYVCFALNGGYWYEFDDQFVTQVSIERIQSCEAYVLFYRKVSHEIDQIRDRASKLSKLFSTNPFKFAVISKQWLNRFNTCAEPGPIDNSDFLCQHGFINPDKENYLDYLTVTLPLKVYEYLHEHFDGCEPNPNITICPICQTHLKRLTYEMDTYLQLNNETQNLPKSHIISINWYTNWHKFVQRPYQEPPGPIDNTKVNINDTNDYFELTESVWNFFIKIYGGGPPILINNKTKLIKIEKGTYGDINDEENLIDENQIDDNKIINQLIIEDKLPLTSQSDNVDNNLQQSENMKDNNINNELNQSNNSDDSVKNMNMKKPRRRKKLTTK